MKTATITLPVELKEQVENHLEVWGITWTEFLKEAMWQHEPNDETQEALKEVETMIATGDYGKTYTDVKQMMKELLE